jgi:hypothetical protein
MNTKTLRDERGARLEELEKLIVTAENQNRDFTKDEYIQYKSLIATIEDLDKDLEVATTADELALKKAAGQFERYNLITKSGNGKVPEGVPSLVRMIKAVKNEIGFHPDDSEKIDQVKDSLRANFVFDTKGFQIDLGAHARAISAISSPWVRETAGPIVNPLRDRVQSIELGAEYLTGLRGDIKLPKMLANTATWLGENETQTDSGGDADSVKLSPKRVGATVEVSNQFFKQSSIDAERWLIDDILQAIAEAVDYRVYQTILEATNTNIIEIGENGGAVDYDALLQMEAKASENSNGIFENGAAFMTNPSVRRVLKSMKFDDGSGKFVWNENTVLGYPAGISNGIPSNIAKGTGTNLSAAILGDFTQVVIGDWSNGVVDVVVDPYSKAEQGITEITVNGYYDVGLKHDESFSAIKDIQTN